VPPCRWSGYGDIASGKDDRRSGFQAALARCRQLGAVLVAARLDRITRRAHTLSQLLEDGVSIRAADMPGADDLMMRIYAAMAQKERELIAATISAGKDGCRPYARPRVSAAASCNVIDRVAMAVAIASRIRRTTSGLIGPGSLMAAGCSFFVLNAMRYQRSHAPIGTVQHRPTLTSISCSALLSMRRC
jgi:hypothetical protein